MTLRYGQYCAGVCEEDARTATDLSVQVKLMVWYLRYFAGVWPVEGTLVPPLTLRYDWAVKPLVTWQPAAEVGASIPIPSLFLVPWAIMVLHAASIPNQRSVSSTRGLIELYRRCCQLDWVPVGTLSSYLAPSRVFQAPDTRAICMVLPLHLTWLGPCRYPHIVSCTFTCPRVLQAPGACAMRLVPPVRLNLVGSLLVSLYRILHLQVYCKHRLIKAALC